MNHADRRTRSVRVFTVGVGGLGGETERRGVVECTDFDGRASGLRTIRSSGEVVPARAADNVRSYSKREIFRSEVADRLANSPGAAVPIARRVVVWSVVFAPPLFRSFSVEMEGDV